MKHSRTKTSATPLARAAATGAMLFALAACGDGGGGGADPSTTADPEQSDTFTIGVIEQQLANPFFAKLRDAAVAKAESLGLDVMTAESKVAGDAESQVEAIENMINRGVKGIVLDPANPSALASVVKEARDAGIIVITVNTSLDPVESADASFETDNFAGGELMGQWALATIGDTEPVVAMLDYDLADKTAAARHNGFLEGFGITDDSPEIAGTALTKSNFDTGREAMENLIAAHPDINTVYTINEPAAQGAFAALEARGVADAVVLVSIDGSCDGVRSVQAGEIGATVMQFPTRMGELAVQAIYDAVVDGTAPPVGINDSGTALITDSPAEGVDSEDTTWGLENCWGE